MKNLVCAILLCSATLTYAGFNEGAVAFDAGNYQVAFKEFKPLAEQGGSIAQFTLGLLYYHGQGIPQSYTQAAHWFQKAAEQGHTKAQSALGLIYRNGQGTPQNYTQAAYWYQKAAEQNDTTAQLFLGSAYENGLGVSQNYSKAIYWYQKAAEQNDADAQYFLGFMYGTGKGIAQNQKIAYILLNLAVSNGSNTAINNRNTALGNLSPSELEDAQRITMQLHNSNNFAGDLRRLLNSQL